MGPVFLVLRRAGSHALRLMCAPQVEPGAFYSGCVPVTGSGDTRQLRGAGRRGPVLLGPPRSWVSVSPGHRDCGSGTSQETRQLHFRGPQGRGATTPSRAGPTLTRVLIPSVYPELEDCGGKEGVGGGRRREGVSRSQAWQAVGAAVVGGRRMPSPLTHTQPCGRVGRQPAPFPGPPACSLPAGRCGPEPFRGWVPASQHAGRRHPAPGSTCPLEECVPLHPRHNLYFGSLAHLHLAQRIQAPGFARTAALCAASGPPRCRLLCTPTFARAFLWALVLHTRHFRRALVCTCDTHSSPSALSDLPLTQPQ